MADDLEFPSPEEMRAWLERERTDTNKAAELRIKDAAAFVDAYSSGTISAEEAEQRLHQFSKRWGDALPMAGRSENMTDEEILKAIDETRKRQSKFRPPGSPNSL
jgi:hypothetical protein